MLRNFNVLLCMNWIFLIILKSSKVLLGLTFSITKKMTWTVLESDVLLKKFSDSSRRSSPQPPMHLITTDVFKLLILKRNQLFLAAVDNAGHVSRRPAGADTSEEGVLLLAACCLPGGRVSSPSSRVSQQTGSGDDLPSNPALPSAALGSCWVGRADSWG